MRHIMANTIVWADTPVTVTWIGARTSNSAVLQAEIPLVECADGDVALLPGVPEQGTLSGDLARGENQKPGLGGAHAGDQHG
jgi:hypothetical protein